MVCSRWCRFSEVLVGWVSRVYSSVSRLLVMLVRLLLMKRLKLVLYVLVSLRFVVSVMVSFIVVIVKVGCVISVLIMRKIGVSISIRVWNLCVVGSIRNSIIRLIVRYSVLM